MKFKRIFYSILATVFLFASCTFADAAPKASIIQFLLSQVRTSTTSLVGGKVYFYLPTTTDMTGVHVWLNKEATVPASNPYTLDANATAQLYATGSYRVIIKDSAGVTRFDRDNLYFNNQDDYSYQNADSYTSLEAAVGIIGSTPTTLLINSAQAIVNSLTIPSTLTLKIDMGGLITIPTTKTLTINSPSKIGVYQAFIYEGTGKVVFGAGAIDAMRPEWFATNTTPGTTDMHAAFEKAIASMFASGVQTLKLSSSKYYFANYVEMANELQNIRITGEAIAGYISGLTGPKCEIMGAPGLSTLFLISANQFGLELDHVRFNGDNITTGVGSAIKSTAMGYPARPFNVHHCFFTNFAKAIYSSPTAGGAGTGICMVNIRENTFYANDYALYGDNNIGAIIHLDFVGNVSEQGGKIKIVSPNAAGPIKISDNLMEGQANPIQIGAGLAYATIERNSFESCTGDIVNFTSGNSGSTLKMGSNYYYNNTGARVTVTNSFFENTDNFALWGIKLNCDLLNQKSHPKTNKFTFAATPATTMNTFNLDIIRDQLGLPAALGGVLVSAGTTLVPTPIGMRGSATITGAGGAMQVTGNLAIGDFIVITALVRPISSTTVQAVLYDDALTYINESTPINMNANGEYTIVHIALKVLATSTGHYHMKFVAAGGATTMVLTDFYVYTVSVPTGATAYYAYLPMLEAAGQATIALNGTSVVVTHEMGLTPRNIIVIPGVDVGHVWVDTIGATYFTINCSSNSHAETVVYWRAN